MKSGMKPLETSAELGMERENIRPDPRIQNPFQYCLYVRPLHCYNCDLHVFIFHIYLTNSYLVVQCAIVHISKKTKEVSQIRHAKNEIFNFSLVSVNLYFQ